MAGPSNGRPLLQLIAAASARLQAANFKPPSNTIEGIKLSDWYSPGQPVTPIAPPNQSPKGWQFWAGQNLQYTPRYDSPLSAAQLEALSMFPLVRLLIENVKDQICRLPWKIQLRPQPGEPKSARMKREAGDKNIVQLSRLFEYPDRENDWSSWLRPMLEDMLVPDAATILKERAANGAIAALRVIRGKMITRYVDENGFTPRPPNPAYAQDWFGMPFLNLTTEQLLYKPRNIVTREFASSNLYGCCYSDDTEVLTRDRGFVLFKDLLRSDLVATRNNETKEFQWQSPTHYTADLYEGDMYHFKSKSVDLMVTPNHRMLTTNSDGTKEKVMTASEMHKGTTRSRKIPMVSRWRGVEVGPIEFDGAKYPGCSFSIEGDDYCALMGAYLAEGNVRSAGGIEIAQQEKSKGFDLYKALITKLNGQPSHNGKAFIMARRPMTEYFRQFGHASEKWIPESIRNASVRQLKIFWTYYMAGDGSYIKRGNASGRGNYPSVRDQITTTSRLMADQLVEIAQKLGWSASLRSRPSCWGKIEGRKVWCRESYVVSVRYSHSMSANSSVGQYSGIVYCVTVPNGIVYVRRNGKPAWSGNSPTEALAPWINFGIQRLLFQTAFYTAGSIPDAMMVVPKGIGPDKIEEASMVLNSQLSGQLNKRRNMSYVQGFTDDGSDKVLFPKAESLTDETDEYLVNILCYGYGQSPSRLRKMMNRATAESSQTASVQEGTLPMVDWLRKCVINPMIQMDFGLYDYEITFDTENELDIVKRAQADKSDVDSGIIKRNEARESRGLDPDDSPEANQLTVTTVGGGVIPLAGSIEAAQVSREMAANPPEPKPTLPAGPQKVAKRGRITIDPRRRTHDSSLAVAKIHGEVAKIFHGQRDRAQHKAKELMKAGAFDLLKSDSPRKVADEIYSSIAVSWDALPTVARHALEQSAISGVFKGVVDLDLTDHSMISAANQTARGYAEHRAAEMVGMKWEDGKLVANPSAKWAISDTTRDELRAIVKNAFETETPMDALVKSIGDAGAFSDSRAQMIASTEVSMAQAKGNYAAWDESGLVLKSQWLLSADHEEDGEDSCEDNAEEAVAFGKAFPSGDYCPPAHPRCMCVLVAVEIAEVE